MTQAAAPALPAAVYDVTAPTLSCSDSLTLTTIDRLISLLMYSYLAARQQCSKHPCNGSTAAEAQMRPGSAHCRAAAAAVVHCPGLGCALPPFTRSSAPSAEAPEPVSLQSNRRLHRSRPLWAAMKTQELR